MSERSSHSAHGPSRPRRTAKASARRWRWTSYALAVPAAGLAAGVAMAATVMLVAEIASEPTAVPGIDSSTWTPVTAITAFLFGPDAFHAAFAVLPILFGLVAHLLLSVAFGAAGFALIVYSLGWRPWPPAAAALGFFFGLALEVVVINVIVNGIEPDNLVYESLPEWGWWAGHAAYGVTLGIATALVTPLLAPAAQEPTQEPAGGVATASAR